MKADLQYRIEGLKRMLEMDMHPMVMMLEFSSILDEIKKVDIREHMECLDAITGIAVELGNKNGCEEEAILLKEVSEGIKKFVEIESKMNRFKEKHQNESKCNCNCNCNKEDNNDRIVEVTTKVSHYADSIVINIDKEIELPILHNIINKVNKDYVKNLKDVFSNADKSRIKITLNNSKPIVLELESWNFECEQFESFATDFARFLEIGTMFI